MSACEICWQRAQEEVFLLGGSVVDRYTFLVEREGHWTESDDDDSEEE